jgi:hypothetical protein
MGKRELLLIAAFALVAIVVYQASAPPPAPGERGFSIGKLFDNVRREISANRSSAVASITSTYPVDGDLREIRLSVRSGEITITGEARDTIEAELQVHSNGSDDAEAERLAKRVELKWDRAGSSLNASATYPAEGRQRVERLVMRVPSRLSVRLDASGSQLTITGVSEAEIAGARGDVHISRIAGRVIANTTGGRTSIEDIGTLKLTARGTEIQLERIKGEAAINVRQGELKIADVQGPVDLDSNGTDIVLEKLDRTNGTLRVNAVNGKLSVRGLRTDGRIDSRNAEVDVVVERAAPLAIYADGEPVQLTPPSTGYQLDAMANGGRITLPDGTLSVSTNGEQQRASGPVRGGGATITIRTTRGDIVVRPRDAEKSES